MRENQEQIANLPLTTAALEAREEEVKDLEKKLKEEREEKEVLAREKEELAREKERLAREKERENADLRRQLQSVRVSAGRGGATPNPQVRREEVICNDIKLLSSLSAAASACLTYPSTADPLTSQLQTRGMCCLMHSVAVCVCVCVRACVRAWVGVFVFVCVFVRTRGWVQVYACDTLTK